MSIYKPGSNSLRSVLAAQSLKQYVHLSVSVQPALATDITPVGSHPEQGRIFGAVFTGMMSCLSPTQSKSKQCITVSINLALSATGHQPVNSYIISRVKLWQAILQFSVWAAADDVKHCLTFATLTLVAWPK